jgi:hypothetical protein
VAVNCREFLALLDAEHGGLPPGARVHAASCAACARAIERAIAVRRELHAMAEEPAPAFLAERVMATVRAERREDAPRPRALWRLRPAPALAAVAAVALFGLVLTLFLRSAPEPVREARSAAARDESAAPARVAPPQVTDRIPPPLPAEAAVPAPTAPARAKSEPPDARVPRAAARAPGEDSGAAASAKGNEARLADRAGAAAVAPDAPAEDESAAGWPGAVGGVAAPVEGSETREPAHAAEVTPASASERQRDAEKKMGATAFAKQEATAAPGQEGVRREIAAALGATPAELVLVTIAPLSSATHPARILHLPAGDAPPPGTSWIVDVARDRTISLRDAAGIGIGVTHPATLAALRGAGLPPGRYLLSRRRLGQ